MKLYSVYDKESRVFNPVIALDDDVCARRYAEHIVRQEGTVQHDYKDDFSMYCVGEYNYDSPTSDVLIKPIIPRIVIDFSSISL